MTAMAVLSAALLAAGVLQHYVDIWKHRTVRGISFIFVGIDAAGDLFSLVSSSSSRPWMFSAWSSMGRSWSVVWRVCLRRLLQPAPVGPDAAVLEGSPRRPAVASSNGRTC